MYALLGFGGMVGAIVAFIILIIKLIQKRPIRNTVFFLIAFIILIVVTLFITPVDDEDNRTQKLTEVKTDVKNFENTSELTEKLESEGIVKTDIKTNIEREVKETMSHESQVTEIQTEKSLIFVLMDGEEGDYGTTVVLNKGTEFEEYEIEYHIPPGKYNVTNNNAFGGAQVTVYCGGPEYDGEWEYFTADDNCSDPIVVMAGETKELVIKDGQFVVLSDGSSNIQFELVNK